MLLCITSSLLYYKKSPQTSLLKAFRRYIKCKLPCWKNFCRKSTVSSFSVLLERVGLPLRRGPGRGGQRRFTSAGKPGCEREVPNERRERRGAGGQMRRRQRIQGAAQSQCGEVVHGTLNCTLQVFPEVIGGAITVKCDRSGTLVIDPHGARYFFTVV